MSRERGRGGGSVHLYAALDGAEDEVRDEVDHAGALAGVGWMDGWRHKGGAGSERGRGAIQAEPAARTPREGKVGVASIWDKRGSERGTHRRSSTKQAARLQMQARHCSALLQRMME